MRIAILGAGGQLGGELCLRLGTKALPFTHADLDVTDPAQIEAALAKSPPDAVVNCAAFNGVDLAESEPEAAFRSNALGLRFLAQFCDRNQIPLVHLSTDYVFGLDQHRQTPYRETDATGPLGVYAVSKLAGEEFVRAGCARHFILRTCGLYGRHAQSGKRNFVETMLRLGKERPEIRVVADQRCTPTATSDLAAAIIEVLHTTAFGTYHATNSGACTWAEFAEEIFRIAGLPAMVIPITTAEYGAKARRPAYSVLDTAKLASLLGRSLPSWQMSLSHYLAASQSTRR